MSVCRLILPDQLSLTISSLQRISDNDHVLMIESYDYFTHVKHHKKKIVFLLSAMRHFADQLIQKGFNVTYIPLEDVTRKDSLKKLLVGFIKQHAIKHCMVTQPSEYHWQQEVQSCDEQAGCHVELLDDHRFLCTNEQFSAFAAGKKQLRMELFYRQMRQQHQVLMDGDKPIGGQWNYDQDNRKPPKSGLDIPDTYHTTIDKQTQAIIELVEENFSDHFGDSLPFHFAVTRRQALVALKQFIQARLALFGDYQDAMLQGEPWMFHSHISFYLNCGLLLPLECIQQAENAYHDGLAPLNAVEGFIRQILGWREYVRGIYWLKMPEYVTQNFFEAKRALPDFYWTGKTAMNCLKQCINETQQNAYAHHIQRLMILGNFALIAGIAPDEVNEWFHVVYADAYQWVELPNVSGMILFADGGYLASKPYAAGGNYVNKMSNYCKQCRYKVSVKSGESACPFNYLYWDFLARNHDKLSNNHRLGMVYRVYQRMDPEKQQSIAQDAERFLQSLD